MRRVCMGFGVGFGLLTLAGCAAGMGAAHRPAAGSDGDEVPRGPEHRFNGYGGRGSVECFRAGVTRGCLCG